MSRPVRRALPVVLLALAVLAGLLVQAGPASAAGTLRQGSTGPAVSCWQKELRWVSLARPSNGVPLIGVSGTYGASTTNATKAFQRATHMTADGVAGDRTQTQMAAELATASRDAHDEYAGDLYYGRCTAPEPMVCHRGPSSPRLGDDPRSSSRYGVAYSHGTVCTKVDPALSSEIATLYLRGANGYVGGSLVRRTGLRQASVSLSKTAQVAAGTYRAVQGLALNGSVRFVSAPGCRRTSSSQILCEFVSSPYTVR